MSSVGPYGDIRRNARVLFAPADNEDESLSVSDWAEVARWAEALDLLPVLLNSARSRGTLGALPREVAERARAHQAQNAAISLELERALHDLLDAFSQEGIPVAPLKGAALLLEGVTAPGLRHHADLDLLVEPRHVREAFTVLGRLGFAPHHLAETPKHLPAVQRGRVLVELHTFAYWTRTGEPIGLRELRQPGEPIARTVAHLVHHCFVTSPLEPWLVAKTACDIQRVREHVPAEKWAQARRAADEAGLAHELQALEQLVDGRPDARTLEWLVPIGEGERRRRSVAQLLGSAWRDPMWFRLALLRSLLVPSRARMAARHGLPAESRWLLLAYVKRPLDLAFKTVAHGARRSLSTLARRTRRPVRTDGTDPSKD